MPKTHGLTANNFQDGRMRRVYKIWANMLQRCTNPNNARFADYGGRGIKVCVRWKKFENFFEDMGLPPDGMTLDRVDNDKGYSPRNCRWADAYTQAKNSRRAVLVAIGPVAMCISDWCRKTGISYGLYKARIKRGWPLEKALTEPPANRGLRALRKT